MSEAIRLLSRQFLVAIVMFVTISLTSLCGHAQEGALPSWTDGPARSAILDFVKRVTTEGGPDFVPIAERIATFDNDGTLWIEQPMYVQAAFVFDRVSVLAKEKPELKEKQPFKAVLDGDKAALAALGEQGLMELVTATHSGMSTAVFEKTVSDWLATAEHPRFHKRYTELVYQPMVELLAHLRSNGFKTFIVSGGGIDFMRPWTEKAYGIPPEQVIGSSGKTAYELTGDTPVINKLAEIDFVDDGAGKPVGINRFIGRRPIFAAGNSDGDLQMLQWTTLNSGPRFAMIVHHTDAVREYAYDRESRVGRLDKALSAAPTRGWLVVDMKNDWKTIFPASP